MRLTKTFAPEAYRQALQSWSWLGIGECNWENRRFTTSRLALGGKMEKANLKKMDFIVAVDLAGQLHEQICNLPPGTKIKGFKTAE